MGRKEEKKNKLVVFDKAGISERKPRVDELYVARIERMLNNEFVLKTEERNSEKKTRKQKSLCENL